MTESNRRIKFLCVEELRQLHTWYFIGVIKLRRMRWGSHITRAGDIRNEHKKLLVRKFKWEKNYSAHIDKNDSIILELTLNKHDRWCGLDLSHVRYRENWRYQVNTVMNIGNPLNSEWIYWLSEQLAASQDGHWSTQLVQLTFPLYWVVIREQWGAVPMTIRRTAIKLSEQLSLEPKVPVWVCPNCRGDRPYVSDDIGLAK